MANELIQVTQLPEITERLRALRESWEQRARDAESMAATEETVKAIKSARADLRREFEDADAQRKAAKAVYMAPWDRIEAVYRECVSDAYKRADTAYKAKIDSVENTQKATCETRLREYFAELTAVHNVTWLRFEQAGLKISLTEAKKKTPNLHMSWLSDFVTMVAEECDTLQHLPETERDAVAAEYKSNGLRLSKAITDVRKRRESEEAEKRAAEERAQIQRRQAESVAKVEAASPPVLQPPEVVEQPPEEKLLTVTFRATATREKLIKLREFMKMEGIMYE